MLIDIHTHLVNPDFNPVKYKKNFAINMFVKKTHYTNFDCYISNFIFKIHESKLDKVVLLAIEDTDVCANNKQVSDICKKYDEFLFGANLNPYSPLIETEIKKIKKDGAVLVKILPSFQNVNLADKKCIPFFELLKEHNLPLLVHTGKEYTLKSKSQNLNNPALLENAARIGVNIICAHCGTRIFFHEKSYFKEWATLALKYENVYGDLSAMITPVQVWDLKKIAKNDNLMKKVLFGTDYPGFPCDFSIKSTGNSFLDSYNFIKSLGFNDIVFSNINKVLNI